jgi:hypothetical protein
MSFFTSDCSLHERALVIWICIKQNNWMLTSWILVKICPNFALSALDLLQALALSLMPGNKLIGKTKSWNWWSKAAKSLAQTQTVVWNRTCSGSLDTEVLGRKSQWLWHAHITSKWDLLETSKKIIPTDKQTQTPSQCQNVGFKHLDVVNGMHILNTVLYNSSNRLQTLPRPHCRHSVPLHSQKET